MKTLFLILFLRCTCLQTASATEIKMHEVYRTLLQNPAVTSETKVSPCPKKIPLVDPGTPSDEIQPDLAQAAPTGVNSRNLAVLPSLMHVTQNSFLLCTLENISISQGSQDGGGEHSPLAGETSAHRDDMEGNGDPCESSTTKPREAGGRRHGNENLGSTNAPDGQDIGGAGNCSVGYDRQSILVLDEDPAVMESASFLYEKCPSVSTLLSYQKGAPRVLRGSPARLTQDSRLVLVGHGGRGAGRPAMLGRYRAEEVARAAATMETEDGRVGSVLLAACELGKDRQFAAQLLRTLRSFRLETALHLHLSLLSISRSGEALSAERGRGRPVWRSEDATNRVIAWLDGTGNLLSRVQGRRRGRVVPGYRGPALYAEPPEWPTHPQMFTPAELRAKYTSIDCLEGLTWGMFFEENEKARASDYAGDPSHADSTFVWLAGQEPVDEPPIKHIVTILDLVREIRYVAKENVNFDLYYALNDCVYKVRKGTLYVSVAGKYAQASDPGDALRFTGAFAGERENLTLPELRRGLRASDFNEFCRQTFQLRGCAGGGGRVFGGRRVFGDGDCERWGRYFMAAVFAESVRNFRTFPLFLMSVVACEVSRLRRPGDAICAAFVEDDPPPAGPTAGPGAWPETGKRGFYGRGFSAADQRTGRDELAWLELALHRENVLFVRTSAWMTAVYGGEDNSELDIFGKVKVVNQYSYASFIESFRGTDEGRKLSRGCMTSP